MVWASTALSTNALSKKVQNKKPEHSFVPLGALHFAYQGSGGAGAHAQTVQLGVKRKNASEISSEKTTVHAQPQWLNQPAPIGSLWKLFVHIYLVGREQQAQDYVCSASVAQRKAEQYCCDKAGERLGREEALARSCGAYFQPDRLGLKNTDWRTFWQTFLSDEKHGWLTQSIPQANTHASPAQILHVLASVPVAMRRMATEPLLAGNVQGRAGAALEHWGGAWRVKTFTWQAQDGVYTGGAAGWLVDGTAVWFASRGSSTRVVAKHAPLLHQRVFLPIFEKRSLAAQRQLLEQEFGDCVRVLHFASYPLKHLVKGTASNKVVAVSGVKNAVSTLENTRYIAHFKNGNTFSFHGSSRQWVQVSNAGKLQQLWGEYSMDEYVARVIDREGSTQYPQAARALGILACSYVQQFARRDGSCYVIDDSSAYQRVSASQASAGAIQAAFWSKGLVVQGVIPQYRLRATANQRTPEGLRFMAWETAEKQAKKGVTAMGILHNVWPTLEIAGLHGGSTCQPQPLLQRWLNGQSGKWHRQLRTQIGYEKPQHVQVCTLALGNPYSDMQRNRIYIQKHRKTMLPKHIRMGILHEYLHLAFKHHPRGLDEAFIESTARTLYSQPATAVYPMGRSSP